MKICVYCGARNQNEAAQCSACGSGQFQYECDSCGNRIERGVFCPTCGVRVGQRKRVCPNCSEIYFSNACPNCGYMETNIRQPEAVPMVQTRVVDLSNPQTAGQVSSMRPLNKWIVFLLCFFLGGFGVHKFYEGRIVMGLVYLFTVGLFGFGWFIDCILLLMKPTTYYV